MSKNTKSKMPAVDESVAESQTALMMALKQHARKRVERVRKWFARDDRETLERRYELGQDVDALYLDRSENGTNKHGHRFIATLSAAFGWDQGVLYGAMAFA